jgi:lipid-A-disaccharide synthase
MASPKIFLSAGEASGEQYGALLMTEIRRLAPEAEFFGLGGTRMASLGLRRVVRAEDVAVMGITEVILHMPRIYAEYRKLKASLRAERPDIAILIDFPDVNLSLAAELRRLHIPVVYFVSPQIWAWKKWRIRGVKRNVTRMLVIFPFEEAFYRSHGIAADFVGHPLADLDRPTVTREAFASENGLDASKFWVGLLPGSRTRELLANLPPMLEAARLLGPQYEYLLPVAPTLQHTQVDAQVQALASQAKGATIQVVHDARAVLLHARASIVASGTATVAQRVIRVAHVAMVNLIAGRRIVPELIQHDFTASKVVDQLRPLLENEEARATMQSDLRSVGALLKVSNDDGGTKQTAIERAARIALQLIPAAQQPRLQSALLSPWPVE